MRLCLILFLSAFLVTVTSVGLGEAEYSNHAERSPFEVPPGLRPRVDFWKDIFTRYGKHQIVVHHRMFPQAVFDVIDLTREGESMSASQYASLRSFIEEQRVARVKAALSRLADGARPINELEERIVNEMRFIRGGAEKYQRMLDEDLVRTQTGIRERFADAIRRSGRYMPYMEQIFRSFDLPVELTRLPFIESSFDIGAYSSVGAAGIWQFMKGTAEAYMRVGRSIDERRDPLIATRAAAQYLRRAYDSLGSWPLAVTSYNHGVGGVARKVQQLGTTDIVAIVEDPNVRLLGFASNNFYAEFLAANEVYRERAIHFPEVVIDEPIRFRQREFPSSLTVRELTRYAGVSVDALRSVNFAFSDRIWSGLDRIPAGYPLRIPTDIPPRIITASTGVSSFHEHTLTHVVRPGETLLSVAKRYKTSASELAALNKISARAALLPGMKLSVRTGGEEPKPVPVVDRTVAPKKVYYTVKRGDTLGGIASKHNVSVNRIRELNNLGKRSALRVGQKLVVTVIADGATIRGKSKAEAKSAVSRTVKSRSVAKVTKTTLKPKPKAKSKPKAKTKKKNVKAKSKK
jgi:membrane-bound lytic murein transglycosylase D